VLDNGKMLKDLLWLDSKNMEKKFTLLLTVNSHQLVGMNGYWAGVKIKKKYSQTF
jgi:hypothetical protein